MVLDTSAVVAILFREAEADRLLAALAADPVRLLGAPTLVEISAVMLAKRGPEAVVALDALLRELDVEVVPMSTEAARFARDAYARFGKGIGSSAVLNYGDCLAYGVAMELGERLLFKGEDFGRTDIAPVSY